MKEIVYRYVTLIPMCARYTLAAAEKEILKAYAAELKESELYKPNYNIAPTDESLLITADEPHFLQRMHFGLVPYNASSVKFDLNTINARNDRLMESSLWRPLIKNYKTCIVLSTGFYEWKRITIGTNVRKDPYMFGVHEHTVFSFAGLWSQWVNPIDKSTYRSFAIITTESNEIVSEIHEKKRMPVILTKEQERIWLSKDIPTSDLIAMCVPFPDEHMYRFPVSERINSVSRKAKPNNDVELMQPLNSE